jgi:hypothetical protein
MSELGEMRRDPSIISCSIIFNILFLLIGLGLIGMGVFGGIISILKIIIGTAMTIVGIGSLFKAFWARIIVKAAVLLGGLYLIIFPIVDIFTKGIQVPAIVFFLVIFLGVGLFGLGLIMILFALDEKKYPEIVEKKITPAPAKSAEPSIYKECPSCKTENKRGTLHCVNCGEKLE